MKAYGGKTDVKAVRMTTRAVKVKRLMT